MYKIDSVLKKFTYKIYRIHGYHLRLNMLSIRQTHIMRDLGFTYKILKNYYVSNSTFYYCKTTPYSSRFHNLRLSKRSSKNSTVCHFISNRIVNIWNSLPSTIINANNFVHFKFLLKNYIYMNIPYDLSNC